MDIRLVFVNVNKGSVATCHFICGIDAWGFKLLGAVVLGTGKEIVDPGNRVNGAGIELGHIVAPVPVLNGDAAISGAIHPAVIPKEHGIGTAWRIKNNVLIGMDILEPAAAKPLGNLGPGATSVGGP